MLDQHWESIVRFRAPEGQIHYGEPTADLKSARIWKGADVWDLSPTTITSPIEELLSPYEPTTIIGIGLNYKGHLHETGLALPQHPVIFRKMPGSITGPYADIAMPPFAPDMDYENELCFILSRPALNVPESADLTSYILGFTIGNDLSSRYWQRKETSGGQACYAKSFDGFCPIGPRIVSIRSIPNFQKLRITTRKDEVKVQDSNTEDMLFGVAKVLAFLSKGTTLPAGTLVMTGTPPGVGNYMKPPQFIKPGQLIECEIEGIGVIGNRFVEGKEEVLPS